MSNVEVNNNSANYSIDKMKKNDINVCKYYIFG